MINTENRQSTNTALRLLGWSQFTWTLHRSKARVIAFLLWIVIIACIVLIIYFMVTDGIKPHKKMASTLGAIAIVSAFVYFRGVHRHVAFSTPKNPFTGVHALKRLVIQSNKEAQKVNASVDQMLSEEELL